MECSYTEITFIWTEAKKVTNNLKKIINILTTNKISKIELNYINFIKNFRLILIKEKIIKIII